MPIQAGEIEVNITEEFLKLSEAYLLKKELIDNKGSRNDKSTNTALEDAVLNLYEKVKSSSSE